MKPLFFFAILLLSKFQFAQSPWVATNAPLVGRYDDISFVTPDTGWAAGTESTNTGLNIGKINYTTDGGISWITQEALPGVYMRSVEFASKTIGFAGGLEYNGQNVFFKTIDGGNTWTDISNVIAGVNRGICGICCVNTNITYAVGVYSSPAYVIKTIDGGNTWTTINMSAYAGALVDVQFIDANNGYVTGQSNLSGEGAVILKTTDGGSTWTKVFTSNLAGEYVWKIQNLDGTNWFASVEAGYSPQSAYNNVFLKSTDGGSNWITKPVALSHYFQGIGFINSQRGWIGNHELFETIDGGDTWNLIIPYSLNNQFNRFQKVNATTHYFSSTKVYKLGNTITSVKQNKSVVEKNWLSVLPNPAKEKIAFNLNLPHKTMFVARLFNTTNQMVWEEVYQKEKGIYTISIPATLHPGIYYVYVMFNEGIECKKVIVE